MTRAFLGQNLSLARIWLKHNQNYGLTELVIGGDEELHTVHCTVQDTNSKSDTTRDLVVYTVCTSYWTTKQRTTEGVLRIGLNM